MRDVRLRLTSSKKTRFTQQARGFHLDAVVQYCKVIQDLVVALSSIDLSSQGLLDFRTFITSYIDQSEFRSLVIDSQRLKLELSEIRYSINLRGPRIRVLRYAGEADYGSEIEEAFERFQQGAVADYRVKYSDWPDMNHVESSIADRVALLFPEVFKSLRAFCEQSSGFFDSYVSKFEREIQFYLAYLDYITPIRALGLSFSLPTLQVSSKSIEATETFDLALAAKLARSGIAVVTNDFQLHGERELSSSPGRIKVGRRRSLECLVNCTTSPTSVAPFPAMTSRFTFLMNSSLTSVGKRIRRIRVANSKTTYFECRVFWRALRRAASLS